jgi:hypothetical protein
VQYFFENFAIITPKERCILTAFFLKRQGYASKVGKTNCKHSQGNKPYVYRNSTVVQSGIQS